MENEEGRGECVGSIAALCVQYSKHIKTDEQISLEQWQDRLSRLPVEKLLRFGTDILTRDIDWCITHRSELNEQGAGQ